MTRHPYRGVAISGKAGSGKSTLLKAIQTVLAKHGIDSQPVSFAEPIKTTTKAVLVDLGLVPATAMEAEWKAKYRTLPQTIGSHLRSYSNSVWTELASARIAKMPVGTVVLNDDCRMRHEIAYLHDFYKVRLEVDREIRLARLGELKGEDHVTETDLDQYGGFNLYIVQDTEHDIATPEFYAYKVLQAAGFDVKQSAQAVL